jgi:hypothetical protein
MPGETEYVGFYLGTIVANDFEDVCELLRIRFKLRDVVQIPMDGSDCMVKLGTQTPLTSEQRDRCRWYLDGWLDAAVHHSERSEP